MYVAAKDTTMLAILAALACCQPLPPTNDNLPVIRDGNSISPFGESGFVNDPLYALQWNLHDSPASIDWQIGQMFLNELLAGVLPPRPQLFILDSRLDVPAIHADEVTFWSYWNAGTQQPFPSGNPCIHSLHVASIAAARTNNKYGIAGITLADIHLVQVLNHCFGSQDTCAEGIFWAVNHGASVINMSLQYGGTPEPKIIEAAQYAESRGVVIVAAAGNYGWTAQTAVPSMLPEVIAVGAIRQNGTRPDWSNAGPQLDLCAPGEFVLGTTLVGFEEWSGTSMASPHVAGVACALLSLNPSMTPAQVKAALYTGAIDTGEPGRDNFFGWGKVSLYRSLHASIPCEADANRDGALTASDFGIFQTLFVSNQLRADINWDGLLTVSDFAAFQSAFAAGCP